MQAVISTAQVTSIALMVPAKSLKTSLGLRLVHIASATATMHPIPTVSALTFVSLV
jgi:hypothetical protein